MKARFAAMLLMSAVAMGQTITKTVDGKCVKVEGWKAADGGARQQLTPVDCPKPHKQAQSVDNPCDGLACTGPVEMLPKPETKPSDITALMEKIAPTPKWRCTTEVTETRITTVCEKAK